MSFKLDRSETFCFKDQDSLMLQLKKEKENTARISINTFLERQSLIKDDKTFGDNSNKVSFTDDGFKDFCQLLGVSSKLLKEINEEGLSSQVMNDRILDRKYKLKDYDFIMDSPKNKVLGCVSNAYNDLSNFSFYNMLLENSHFKIYDFDYCDSYLINTKLSLRFLSKKLTAGNIRNEIGLSKDQSRIGIEVRNSMVGTSAISAMVFILRLVCMNGMSVITGKEAGRVFHRGRSDTFDKRIDKRILPVLRKMRYYKYWVEKLMNIDYDPVKLVENKATKLIYELYPLSRFEKEKRDNLIGKKVRDFDIERISSIPEKAEGEITSKVFHSIYRNNASMFDFVNIFNENINYLPIKKRLEAEENTGKLANWIYDNRRKFN